MTKKLLILVFLLIFLAGFVIGYITMAFDIKNGFVGQKDARSIWTILSPF